MTVGSRFHFLVMPFAFLAVWAITVTAGGSCALAVPTTALVEGVLLSTGGGPAADGQYTFTFSLYAALDSPAPAWQEVVLAVDVQGGRFQHRLGSVQPVGASAFAALNKPVLGVRVGQDPELPRQPLDAVPFAWRAAAAETLACSGCVTGDMLDPKVLQGYATQASLSKVALSGKYSDLLGTPDMAVYVKTATLADVALTGAYADLTGAPSLGSYAKTADLSKVALSGKFTDLTGGLTLGTSCGTGLVVKGLKVDGSLECVSLSSLPPDGLNEVSNGLLSNEFLDTFALDKVPVGISDNNPVGTGGEIDVPDVGVARALTVSVDVVNSDISSLRVVLYDPANNEYVLHDKTGKVGESVKTSYPTPTKSVSGDLTTWVGKNPKGKWRLVVIDGKFLNNATDGAIQAFSLTIETLSNGKTLAKGALVLQGGVQLPVYAKAPFACDASHYGYAYLDSKTHDLNVCRLKWSPVMFRECGNGLLEFPEECDNGVANSDTADKCRTTCVKAKCGDVIKDAAEFCDDGNGVNDDGCPNDCSNPNPSVVFTALVTGSQTPPLAVGSIPGKVGKKIVIQKVGMCGDSDATSGPNVFSVSGAGLSFTWAAGQSNPGPTHWLNPVPVSGASRGFSYADVNYAGQVGQGVTVSWDTHVDWDGLRCTGTDMMGNIYDDATASSLRVWLLYGYQ